MKSTLRGLAKYVTLVDTSLYFAFSITGPHNYFAEKETILQQAGCYAMKREFSKSSAPV